MMKSATRFAPSPTGLLHLGHAASAFHAFEWAKREGARFVLRVEDIDFTRCQPKWEAAMLEDLRWLGLVWEMPVRRQSDHLPDYERALQTLRDAGLLYRCFLTRKEVMAQSMSAPHGAGQVYFGPREPLSAQHERDQLDSGKPFAWRLSLKRAQDYLEKSWNDLEWLETGHGDDQRPKRIKANPALVGDVILARKDIQTSYHLAVTHDDALQQITHIIRGEDLFESTHIHVLLQALLGLPTPQYHHHGLLQDEAGRRLAKRAGSASLRDLREAGLPAEAVRKMAHL